MQVIRTDGRPGGLLPIIPPVSGLKDIKGVVIALDCDVMMNRFRDNFSADFGSRQFMRARVVSIGDAGLPGREVLKVRPHGSNYLETARPNQLEIHEFDEYQWLKAETEAAAKMGEKIDLEKTLFGGFYFEQFKNTAANLYEKGRGQTNG